MPRVISIGKKLNVTCWSQHEIDKIPNVCLGKNGLIKTNSLLQKDKRLSGFVNDRTMGALDNYAKHENVSVYITPLENDLFDDLAISVYENKKSSQGIRFPMKLPEGEKALPEFLRDLYTKIAEGLHPEKKEQVRTPIVKASKMKEFTDYAKIVAQRIDDKRIDMLRNFVEKNQDSDSIVLKTLADAIEYRNYDKLYK